SGAPCWRSGQGVAGHVGLLLEDEGRVPTFRIIHTSASARQSFFFILHLLYDATSYPYFHIEESKLYQRCCLSPANVLNAGFLGYGCIIAMLEELRFMVIFPFSFLGAPRNVVHA